MPAANAVSAEQGFLNTPEGKGYVNKATLVDKALLGNGVGIGLRKGDTANLTLINNALAALLQQRHLRPAGAEVL